MIRPGHHRPLGSTTAPVSPRVSWSKLDVRPPDLGGIFASYWRFADPFDFRGDQRLFLEREREHDLDAVANAVAAATRGLTAGVTDWGYVGEGAGHYGREFHAANRKARERSKRAIRSSERAHPGRWREIAMGHRVEENLAAVFAGSEDEAAQLSSEIADARARLEAFDFDGDRQRGRILPTDDPAAQRLAWMQDYNRRIREEMALIESRWPGRYHATWEPDGTFRIRDRVTTIPVVRSEA